MEYSIQAVEGMWGEQRTVRVRTASRLEHQYEVVPVHADLSFEQISALGYDWLGYLSMRDAYGPSSIGDAHAVYCDATVGELLVAYSTDRGSLEDPRLHVERIPLSVLLRRCSGDPGLIAVAERVSAIRESRSHLDALAVRNARLDNLDITVVDRGASVATILRYAAEAMSDRLIDIREEGHIDQEEHEAILRYTTRELDLLSRKPALAGSIGAIADLGDPATLVRGVTKDDVLRLYPEIGLDDEQARSIASETNARLSAVEGDSLWGEELRGVVGDWVRVAHDAARLELAPLELLDRQATLEALRGLRAELDPSLEPGASELVSECVTRLSRIAPDLPLAYEGALRDLEDSLVALHPLAARHLPGVLSRLSRERPVIVESDLGNGPEKLMLTETTALLDSVTVNVWCRVDSFSDMAALRADGSWEMGLDLGDELGGTMRDHMLAVPARDLSGIGYVDVDRTTGKYLTSDGGAFRRLGEAHRHLDGLTWTQTPGEGDARGRDGEADAPSPNPPLSSALAEMPPGGGGCAPARDDSDARGGEAR